MNRIKPQRGQHRGQHRSQHRNTWELSTRTKRLVAVPLVLALMTGAAWAYWTAGSIPGGNGASAATSVNQGPTPTASATGAAVTVSWGRDHPDQRPSRHRLHHQTV